MVTVRTILSIVATQKWHIHQMEVDKDNTTTSIQNERLRRVEVLSRNRVCQICRWDSYASEKYDLEIISKLGLGAAKPVATRLEVNAKLTTKEYDDHLGTSSYVVDELLPDPSVYQRLIGKLLYLTMTRPDLAFSV
ncbi:uncharacterized protein [Nicotiana sylvestris]|uniref:Uncharacterized protein LOC104241871 n=1 Tax=Nicotiana sylvestris TaxID=4096 RepID=A0A1U7Y7A2_NICSY|nr:PREDICTED: uncharacterized protein LOC104241871 [Nicotiana sylvestris]